MRAMRGFWGQRLWGAVFLTLGCSGGGSSANLPDASRLLDAAMVAPLPDLRFKWVGAFPSYTSQTEFSLVANLTVSREGQSSYTPVELGSGDFGPGQLDGGMGPSSWHLAGFTPTAMTESLTTIVTVGNAASMASDLDGLRAQGLILTSLDVANAPYYATVAVAPSVGSEYAASATWTGARAQLDAWVASEGVSSRVITAVASVGGNLQAFSFGRSGDTSVYETQVVDVTLANLDAQVTALAAGRYVISAMGRSGSAAYVLIGSRPKGTTAVRTAAIKEVAGIYAGNTVATLLQGGQAIVGWFYDPVTNSEWLIGER